MVEAECNMIGIAISHSHPTIRTTDGVAKVSFAGTKHSLKLLLFRVPLCSYDFLCSSLPAMSSRTHPIPKVSFVPSPYSRHICQKHKLILLEFTITRVEPWIYLFLLCLLVIVTFWPFTDRNSLMTVLQSKLLGTDEICQNFYTTRFSGQKFYTQKVYKWGQWNCRNAPVISVILVRIQLCVKNSV